MASFDPEGPALPPPLGEESDFENRPDGNATVNAIVTVCLALSTFFLVLRAYSKMSQLKNFGLADIIIVPAYALYVTFCGILYRTSVVSGWFVHQWDIRLKDLTIFFYMLFLATQMYLATMIFLKSAILVEWVGIFSPGRRHIFYWTCYTVAGLNALYYLLNIVLENTAYSPREFYWDKAIPNGKINFDASKLALSSAIMNLIFDVVILILPIKVIWGLNMSTKRKFGVSLVFVVGLIAVASALARLITSTQYISSGDFTYELTPAALLCLAEMTAGMLVFAIPASPKPLAYVASQAGHSIERLLTLRSSRSNESGTNVTNSGAGGYGRYISSSRTSKSRVYENVDEQPQVALRSYKSRESARSQQSGRSNGSVPSKYQSNAAQPDMPNSGIVKATDFKISSGTKEDGHAHDKLVHDRHYP